MSAIRMSAEAHEAHQRRTKAIAGRECPEQPKRKYRNEPQQVGDDKYRSKKEMRRHQELMRLEKLGTVRQIRREVSYILAPGVVIGGRKRPPLRYFADFVYEELADGFFRQIIEDCKGMRTQVYIAKRHLMKAIHNIDIRET